MISNMTRFSRRLLYTLGEQLSCVSEHEDYEVNNMRAWPEDPPKGGNIVPYCQ